MFYVVYFEVSQEFGFEFEFCLVEESSLIQLRRQKPVKFSLAVSSKNLFVYLFFLLTTGLYEKILFLTFAGVFVLIHILMTYRDI